LHHLDDGRGEVLADVAEPPVQLRRARTETGTSFAAAVKTRQGAITPLVVIAKLRNVFRAWTEQ
jgi:hypothetical protein